MAVIDAQPYDQIVITGRTTTHRELPPEWTQGLRHSLQQHPEDLTVQVKLTPKGCWHKKAIGGKRTACGEPLGGYASRDESYAGELCEDCFTDYELLELARLADPEVPVDPVDEDR